MDTLEDKYHVDLTPISIGVDIGKVADPTTICICEVQRPLHSPWQQSEPEPERTLYIIRHIERLQLGTSYPDVTKHIVNLLCDNHFKHRSVFMQVDVTGVGRPIYDDLYQKIRHHEKTQRIALMPVSFTYGNDFNRVSGAVGKGFMVSRLQSLLQNGRIHAPDISEVNALVAELKVFEVHVNQSGYESYGAHSGKKDDLVVSLILASLIDPYALRVTYSARIY